jgi:hypothetical protein
MHRTRCQATGCTGNGYHSTVTNAALAKMSSTTSRFSCPSLAKHFNSDRRHCHNGIKIGFIRKRQHWKIFINRQSQMRELISVPCGESRDERPRCMILTETVPLAPNATPFYSQPGLSGLVAPLGPNQSLENGGVPDKPCALRYDPSSR